MDYRYAVVVLLGLTGCLDQPRSTDQIVAHASQPRPSPAAGGGHKQPRSDPATQPREFGAVHWLRSLDAAQTTARRSGKPILILFTEVPGCSTVRGFADGALNHPLLVDAIEDRFVPLAIRNNRGGRDREVLQRFNEPAWNNPVVRVVDGDLKPVAGRYGSDWSTESFATYLQGAISVADGTVPRYVSMAARETSADRKKAIFSMYCFWTGEVKLAGIDGVISTRPGYYGQREAVEVTWDANTTTLASLVEQAGQTDAASGYVAPTPKAAQLGRPYIDHIIESDGTFRYSPKDDNYQIRDLDLNAAHLTPLQTTCANRARALAGHTAAECLSPRQRRRLDL